MTSSEFTHCFWTRQGLLSFSKNINQNSCFTKMKRPSLVLKQWILRERPRDKLLHSIVHFVNLLVPRFLAWFCLICELSAVPVELCNSFP